MNPSYTLLRTATFLLVFSFCGARDLSAQPPSDWPKAHMGHAWATKIYNDAIVCYADVFLKRGDTLRGTVKLFPYATNGYPIYCWRERTPRTFMVNLDRRKIAFVRTYPNPFRPDTGYTDFVNLHNKDLWRKLAWRGNWTIYDDYVPTDGVPPFGRDMILVGKEKKWIKIYHLRHRDIGADVGPRILSFINLRYHQQFQPQDFKDQRAMMEYILDRETGVLRE